MKSDKENINQTLTSLKQVQKKQLQCAKGNKIDYACMRENCTQNAFICINKDCQCKKDHKKCVFELPLRCLETMLQNKTLPLINIGEMIERQVQLIIDQLSQFQDKLKLDLLNSSKYVGFTELQSSLMGYLRSGVSQGITGHHIYQVQQDYQKYNLKQYQIAQKNITKSLQIFKEQIKSFKFIINQELFNPKKCLAQMLKSSKIIKAKDDFKKLTNFFDRKIIKAEILFRASQNQFSGVKFRQKCLNSTHTITIIETNQGKKFGGYTPIPWVSNNTNYSGDNERKSFIFQLNNNDKFTLKAEYIGNAIRNDSSFGPTFGGGHDFYISNGANSNKQSYANINHSYINSGYTYKDTDSHVKFSGEYKFTVKQYEVWKLQF